MAFIAMSKRKFNIFKGGLFRVLVILGSEARKCVVVFASTTKCLLLGENILARPSRPSCNVQRSSDR
jgi:hypothetical protein